MPATPHLVLPRLCCDGRRRHRRHSMSEFIDPEADPYACLFRRAPSGVARGARRAGMLASRWRPTAGGTRGCRPRAPLPTPLASLITSLSATSRPKGMRPGPWSAARLRRLPPAARRLRGIRARPPPCECVVYRAGVTGWAGCFGGQGFWVATVRDSTHATNPNSRPPQALARSSVAGTVLAGACLRFRAGGWGGSGMASRRLSPLPPPPRVPRPPSL